MIKNTTKENAIILKNISKNFKVSHSSEKISIFNNFNLEIEKGENLGIIGKNGGGKSVLLKLIAGIYKPNSGEVNIDGSILYLTSFNQGLKARLTLIDNIYLIGALYGLKKKEIEKHIDEIITFADLEEFRNHQLYTFSTGMMSKLAFSIVFHLAISKGPDIILLDEVFSTGGDITFKRKAIDKIKDLMKGGSTVIFVSHSLNLINEYCDRAIWIDNGMIKKEGNSKEITREYINLYAKN